MLSPVLQDNGGDRQVDDLHVGKWYKCDLGKSQHFRVVGEENAKSMSSWSSFWGAVVICKSVFVINEAVNEFLKAN